jgi:hypothetical protein
MYERLTINTGVAAVAQYHSIFDIQSSTDGVTFASPDKNNYFSDVYMPDTLRTWLMDIRLLRHIPIAYFVPDAALLPPESIRFFNIDPTWMDRVVDGVFAAANTGTVDSVFSASMLAMTRAAIDADLFTAADDLIPGNGWNPSDGMTGMLIRSELVRRWPDMIIRAFKKELDDDGAKPTDPKPNVPVLRAETISKDIYIAIFAGTPALVHVREPNVGVRFGVEDNPTPPPVWAVDRRASNGSPVAGSQLVFPRNLPNRTLDIAKLATALGNSPRMVALHLEQLPYVQEFKSSVAEPAGSVPFSNFVNADGSLKTFNLRKGRVLNLAALQDRMIQLNTLYPQEKP